MEIRYLNKKKCLLLLSWVLISISVFAQQKAPDTIKKTQDADSITSVFVIKIKKKGAENTKKSIHQFNMVRTAIRQETLLENIKKATLKAQVFIKAGIDTVGINNELEYVQTLITPAGDGIFTNKGTKQTFRNLTTTAKVLQELLNRTNVRKELIDGYEKDLVRFRYKIDSLSADTDLYNIPKDSVLAREYAQKINLVAAEVNPADTALTFAVNNIHKLQKKVNEIAIKLNTNLEEIDNYQAELSVNTFSREFANLGDDGGYSRPFNQIAHFSLLKAKLNFSFYARNNAGRIFLIFLLLTCSIVFLTTLRKMALHENHAFDDLKGNLALRYPLLSAIVIILNLGQFIFPEPPFVFNCLF